MRTETKIWMDLNISKKSHKKVNMKKCADNGYDFKEYFINEELTDLSEIEENLKHFHSYNDNSWLEEVNDCEDDYDEDEDYEDDYDEEDAECEYSLIQLRVAKVLLENGTSPDKVKKVQLYLDLDSCDFSGDWADDPGYEETYCLGGEQCYLLIETEDGDYVLTINSDFYDSCDSDFETADLAFKSQGE